MTAAGHWERLKDVFELARQLPPAERDACLDRICGGDEELKREAESLLRSLAFAGPFMETPPVGALAEVDPMVGSRMGAWRLAEEIGRGGMGAVYRAVRDDEEFQKEAALKLLSAGAEGPAVAARFRAERQILARLDHPNIARLLDGGTAPDGRPYLVMELVRGEPIDRYCSRNGLGPRARLELFATACDAVQLAHQNLVIHRDIKPGNILVTAEGTPKLLDFGIAKLLEPDDGSGAATVTEIRALTPRYASPEQITGHPITTSSDVYSLGVLLYELLAGRPPYELRTRAPEELLQVVCHQEPERPSRAARASVTTRVPTKAPAAHGPAVSPRDLEGDLDWIVLKALRKEPGRRYASARDLAEDIRRHLDGLPVQARPDTLHYRASKFVRRHRPAVAAAVLLVFSLAGGLLASFWEWRRAEAAHREAERRFDDTRRLAGSLLFEVHDAIDDLPGSTRARELIVKRGVEYLDRLAASSVDDDVKAELAAGYLRLGDVQGREGDASLGQTATALESYRKAVRLAEAIGSARSAPAVHREVLALAYRRLAEALRATGERERANQLLSKAVAILEGIVAADPANPLLAGRLAATRFDQANALSEAGDWAAALEAFGRAAALYETLAQAQPDDVARRRNVALAYRYLGGVTQQLGRFADARRLYEKAVQIDRGLLAGEANNATARLDLSYDIASTAKLDGKQDRLAPAIDGLREALALRRSVLAADPVNVQARAATARAHEDLAWLLSVKGDRPAAEAEARRSVAERETLASGAQGGLDPPLRLAWALETLGDVIVVRPPRNEPTAAELRGPRGPEACALYRRSRRLFSGIEDRLPSPDRLLGGKLAQRLESCEATGPQR